MIEIKHLTDFMYMYTQVYREKNRQTEKQKDTETESDRFKDI